MPRCKPVIERIKSRLVLEAVAEAEKIEVTEAELEDEIARMSAAYRMDIDKLKEMMSDAEKKQLKDDLAVQKAADFLVENAKETGAKKTAAKKTAKKAEDAEGEEKPKKTAAKKVAKKADDAEGEEKPKKTTTRKKKTEEEA